jgi:hypothetical protein
LRLGQGQDKGKVLDKDGIGARSNLLIVALLAFVIEGFFGLLDGF